ISSMITDASVRPRPEPPYSCGISAANQPALVNASTKASGKARCASTWRWYSSGNCAHSARTASRSSPWDRTLLIGVIVASRELGARLHGQRALMTARPQHDAALVVEAATDVEQLQVEQRRLR